jgi:hypothetical protein
MTEGMAFETALDGTGPGVQRFRKRPVVIEAMRWVPGDLVMAGELIGWLIAHGGDFRHPSGMGETTTLAIRTLEGEMLAQPGDWIICGVKNELYPCREDIFAETYEPVADAEVCRG